jgi:uncharacterized protein YqjF (DUF2071 family)
VHSSLKRTDHRPWELPERPWRWRQSWLDLLFAHFPVPARTLEPLVPKEIEIEEFDGTSWVGVVPFRMEGVTPRSLPDLPRLSAFAELNLRLYVRVGRRPGIWFVSLDAANRLAVWAARRWFHLPYPWPLQRAEAEIEENQVAGPQGIDLSGAPTLLHFASCLDVVVWNVDRVHG